MERDAKFSIQCFEFNECDEAAQIDAALIDVRESFQLSFLG